MSLPVLDKKITCTRHFLTEDGTHVFYEYEGNFTAAKNDDFGDKLHEWFMNEHNNPLVPLFVSRTYANTSDRWKNVKVEETKNDATVILTANGVDEIVTFANKVVFL